MLGRQYEPVENKELYDTYSDYRTNYSRLDEEERKKYEEEIKKLEAENNETQQEQYKKSITQTLDSMNNGNIEPDSYSENKLNRMVRDKVNTDNVYYVRPGFRGRVAKKLVPHEDVSKKGNILENTIKKYPNLIKKLNEFDGNIIINETSEEIYGKYDSNNNEIVLTPQWQQMPERERAETLFHELKHYEQSRDINQQFRDSEKQHGDREAKKSVSIKGEVLTPLNAQDEFTQVYQNEVFEKGYADNEFEKEARVAGAEGLREIEGSEDDQQEEYNTRTVQNTFSEMNKEDEQKNVTQG